MDRPYPNRRRRRRGRPRRRPRRSPRTQGFTSGLWGTYYDALLPELRGREKREFFNQISLWLMLGFAVGGAVVGFSVLGVPGAILGFGAGGVIGGAFCVKQRFYRP